MYFEHNIEIFQRFEPVILEHHECCLVGTMGTGKTDISIEFIKKYNQKALIIVPSVYLGKQWKDVAEKNDISTLSVVTYHTFSKAFAVLAAGYDCYIFDEAHHMDSPVWGKAIRKFREMIDESRHIIGLTGDPIRYFDSCKNVVDTMFHGHVVYGIDQYDAIMKGILPNVIYVCAIYDTKGLYNKYRGMATTKHLQGKLNLAYENCKKINDILVSHAMNHMKGFVFVDKIESISSGVDLISKAFPDMPVYSAHSKMTKNEKTDNIDGFKNSNTGFMVSVNMFNEGHHVNGANTVIMLRKTGSPTIYAQQIGRALSANHSGTAIIYDFVANNESMKTIGERISIITRTIENKFDNSTSSKRNDRISGQVIVHDHSKDFLEVIEEIAEANSGISWHANDDEFLINNYKSNGVNFCAEILNKSKVSCRKRARELGLIESKFKSDWHEEEDAILKEFYPTIGTEVASKLNKKSKEACKFRAAKLGIKYISQVWTPEEDEIIKEFYPIMGSDVVSKLPGRTKVACVARARTIGVGHDDRLWTHEEDSIFKEFYPIIGSSVADKLPGRSREACKSRAKILGIEYKENNGRLWTPEEDAIIKEFYPIMGKNVASKLPRRSESACAHRAIELKATNYNVWTPEEDAIIKEFYPTMSIKVASKLPGRTKAACVTRAKRIGVVVSNYKWTPEEDAIIKEFYPTIGSKITNMLKNKTVEACRGRAKKLGIRRNKNRNCKQ